MTVFAIVGIVVLIGAAVIYLTRPDPAEAPPGLEGPWELWDARAEQRAFRPVRRAAGRTGRS